jgi:hypothetical protein
VSTSPTLGRLAGRDCRSDRRCHGRQRRRPNLIPDGDPFEWVLTMADGHNDGHHWPHPAARRGFASPKVDPVAD